MFEVDWSGPLTSPPAVAFVARKVDVVVGERPVVVGWDGTVRLAEFWFADVDVAAGGSRIDDDTIAQLAAVVEGLDGTIRFLSSATGVWDSKQQTPPVTPPEQGVLDR